MKGPKPLQTNGGGDGTNLAYIKVMSDATNDKAVTIQYEKYGRNGAAVVKEKTFKNEAALEKWAAKNEDANILRYSYEGTK
jgi:predicted DNA-binding WGR domain protein